MTRAVVEDTGHPFHYGIGVWLHPDGAAVMLDGCDHGVCFRSVHEPRTGLTATVVGNTTDGAWPIARLLRDRLF